MPTDWADRFNAKVDRTDDCWLWTAAVDKVTGYGRFRLNRKTHNAHRLAYELHVGLIPAGLQIDHLCRVRHCVNPAHLELVTAAENVRRGRSGLLHVRPTHCPHGHEFTSENTYHNADRRFCRQCHRDRGWRARVEHHRQRRAS